MVDDTGNSRFWTIPVISINYKHGIDVQQVWAQAYQLYQDSPQWWLDPEEERELEKYNAKHRSVNSIRDIIHSALDMDVAEEDRKPMSASQLLRHLEINNPSNAQCKDAGAALRELLGEPNVSQGLNRWKIPLEAGEEFHKV